VISNKILSAVYISQLISNKIHLVTLLIYEHELSCWKNGAQCCTVEFLLSSASICYQKRSP